MKLTVFSLLALATSVLAAPVPNAEAHASPGYGKYGGYGTYPPPKGSYGSYGTYKRDEDKVFKRDYASYGDYEEPAGGYGSYGDYDGVTAPTPAASDAVGYGTYDDYPEPAGGYGSYGSYRRSIVEFVKRIFH